MDRAAKLRAFYAHYITQRSGVGDQRIEQAFATVPRENFVGPAPWFIPIFSAATLEMTYLQTPDDDPAFVYGNHLIALDRARRINNGEPTLHALCIDALAIRPGADILHIGAGSGYYTAILAYLAGPAGRVFAFEIDPELAAWAARNLAGQTNVSLAARSGTASGLPAADIIYVSAGITQPEQAWLTALRPGGRLLFPLQPERGFGGMLLAAKPEGSERPWPARFVSRAGFIACEDARQDGAAGAALKHAFDSGGWQGVKSLHLEHEPDETCWLNGESWWLSTQA